MTEYKISINLQSACLLGSGEGWGSVIDMDIVFNSMGLPYFPAKRLKGCIRESGQELLEMMDCAGIRSFDSCIVDTIFGSPGDIEGAKVVFNNLYLPNYEDMVPWCRWSLQEFREILSPEVIVNSFTKIGQQISINDKGIADDQSLRTFRVLKPGITFEGSVILKEETSEVLKFLALSCLNLRHVGTMRNKGYGKVRCRFKKGEIDLSKRFIEQLAKEVM